MNPIKHVALVVHAMAREKQKGRDRSPHWETFRKQHLAKDCAACGSKRLLQLHHVAAFHEHPERELDPTNVITLCTWRLCHLLIGHLGAYTATNDNAREDADFVRKHPEQRKLVIKNLAAKRSAPKKAT